MVILLQGRSFKYCQLFGAITSTHCEIPHGGQEKTFDRLSEKYHGIIRPEVRWLLKHCKVCRLGIVLPSMAYATN